MQHAISEITPSLYVGPKPIQLAEPIPRLAGRFKPKIGLGHQRVSRPPRDVGEYLAPFVLRKTAGTCPRWLVSHTWAS
jgi:hypothetical protein